MSVFRRPFARLFAVPVLAMWLVGVLAPALVAHDEPDLECGEGVWNTDHHETAFEDVRPPAHSGHCDVCHLQRALRGLAAESGRAVGALDLTAVHLTVDLSLAVSADRPSGPSRAPPSARL